MSITLVSLLEAYLGDVLVTTDSGSLKRLRRDLLILIGQEMDSQRELIDTGLFVTQVIDSDLWVWECKKNVRGQAYLGLHD
jgi:hypothetical protein